MANNPSSLTNVINPNGELVSIDPTKVEEAVNYGGYRLPSPDEVTDLKNKETYGSGVLNPLAAGLAGAGRAATFGLSDQALVRSGAVKPETLSKLAQYNPEATTLGEVGGVAAGLLAPELLGAGAAAEGAEGAGLLAKAALNNPVRKMADLAEGIKGAITPETSGLASKILAKAGAGALGSAVEGAAYGLGESVSEQALGDPSLNGEKVLANIGHGALYGGALGGILDGAMGSFGKEAGAEAADRLGTRAAEEIPGIAEARSATADSFEGSIKGSLLPQTEKEGILDGLKKLKRNVGDIDQAGDRNGWYVTPAQRSDSELVQNRYGMSTQSPSPFGVAEQQRVHAAVEKVGDDVNRTFGSQPALSDAELGTAIKTGISSKLEEQLKPLQDGFSEFKEKAQAVPVSDKAVNQIAGNIRKLPGLVNSEGKALSEGSAAYQFATRVADDLSNLKTLDDVSRYKTMIRQETIGKPELRYVAGEIQEKLSNLEEKSMRRLADTMRTPQAKEKVLSWIEQQKTLRAQYGEFAEKLSDLGAVTGKSKVYGPQHFLDFLSDVKPEKLAQKMTRLARNDSQALSMLREQFPNEFNLIKGQLKNDIRSAALENGELNVGKALKAIDKLSPEAKAMFWDPKELQVLKDAQTWYGAWPKKWGPSGTPQGIQYIDFFRHPASATGMTVRDFANLKFANHFAGTGNAPAKIAGLSRIERLTQDTSRVLKRSARNIFEESAHATAAYEGLSGSAFQKKRDDLLVRTQNPEKLIDDLDQHTRALYSVAPQTAGAVQATAIRATGFLNSKLPQMPAPKPFGRKLEPSKAEISRFNRFHAVVENPMGVLAQVKAGTLTPDHLEALQTVYPKLYQEMQASVMNELTNHLAKKNREEIPYQRRLSLSMFLGQDLDSSTESQSLQATQAALAQLGQGPQAEQGPNSQKFRAGEKLTNSQAMQTPLQALGQGGNLA